jgi:hypothetical protein
LGYLRQTFKIAFKIAAQQAHVDRLRSKDVSKRRFEKTFLKVKASPSSTVKAGKTQTFTLRIELDANE